MRIIFEVMTHKLIVISFQSRLMHNLILMVDNEAHILHFYEGHLVRVLVYYHHFLRVKSKTHNRMVVVGLNFAGGVVRPGRLP